MFGRKGREVDKERAAYRTAHDLIVRAVGSLDLDARMKVWDALCDEYDRWKPGLTLDQVYPTYLLVREFAPSYEEIRSYRDPSPFLMQVSTSGIE